MFPAAGHGGLRVRAGAPALAAEAVRVCHGLEPPVPWPACGGKPAGGAALKWDRFLTCRVVRQITNLSYDGEPSGDDFLF